MLTEALQQIFQIRWPKADQEGQVSYCRHSRWRIQKKELSLDHWNVLDICQNEEIFMAISLGTALMVKPVSTHYNSPKLITYGGYHRGTTAPEYSAVLDFGPIKRMYGDLHMLMEITASTAFRARKATLVFSISPANWSSTCTHHVFLCWGSQGWTQYYRWDITRAE